MSGRSAVSYRQHVPPAGSKRPAGVLASGAGIPDKQIRLANPLAKHFPQSVPGTIVGTGHEADVVLTYAEQCERYLGCPGAWTTRFQAIADALRTWNTGGQFPSKELRQAYVNDRTSMKCLVEAKKKNYASGKL